MFNSISSSHQRLVRLLTVALSVSDNGGDVLGSDQNESGDWEVVLLSDPEASWGSREFLVSLLYSSDI